MQRDAHCRKKLQELPLEKIESNLSHVRYDLSLVNDELLRASSELEGLEKRLSQLVEGGKDTETCRAAIECVEESIDRLFGERWNFIELSALYYSVILKKRNPHRELWL